MKWPWSRKPKVAPMRVTPFPAGETAVVRFNVDGYKIENLPSFAALLDLLREKAATHLGRKVIATLDDFGQAAYTSGHATDANDLEYVEDDEEYENEPPPEVSFARIRASLIAKAKDLSLESLKGRLYWAHPDAIPFVELNQSPDAVIDRKETYLLLAPVTHAFEAIAAFPNGYFTQDLSPMENLALARHLEETYGYSFIGIGASYIAFLRSGPLAVEIAHALAADLQSIHHDPDPSALPAMAAVLQQNNWLLLFYSAR